MRRRSGFRLLAIVAMLAMLVPAWSTTAARQATPNASPAGEDVITGQRLNAVPLGEAGQVGDVSIVVNRFDQDASSLAAADSGIPLPANRTIVNIELSLSNNGTEPLDARNLIFMTAGNRGLLLVAPGAGLCTVEANVLRPEEVIVEPGATIAGNFCAPVLAEDVASLQLLVIDSAAVSEGVAATVQAGTWFNLGGAEPFDPSAGMAAASAARDRAVTTTLDAPAAPSDTVLVNGVAITLLEYIPDAAAEFAAVDSLANQGATLDSAYAMFDMVNTGTGVPPAGITLVDGSGFSGAVASIPEGFREVTGTGYLLPGGSSRVHGAWPLSADLATTRAFRFAGGTDTGWMLAADGNSTDWNLPATELASPASTDAANPVPYGQTASVAGLNLTLTPGGAYNHTLTMAAADILPNGEQVWITIAYGDESLENCHFVTTDGNTTSSSGSFSRTILPGAQQTFDISCDDGGTTPLTIGVELGGSEEVTGSFARSGDVQAQPATDSTDAEAETAPGSPTDQPADAAAAGGETATVTAATANVRAEPTTTGAIVAVLAAGDEVTITGEGVMADGYTWLPVTLADGTTGWIAEQLIQRG